MNLSGLATERPPKARLQLLQGLVEKSESDQIATHQVYIVSKRLTA